MRLLFVLAASLALSLAESEQKHYEDLEAAESIELLKTHDLDPSATAYNPVPYAAWDQPQYPPQQNWPQQNWPQHNNPPPYVPSQPTYPVQSDYKPPPPTTTPVPVITNYYNVGPNGAYTYEYKLGDGTWVYETGYITRDSKGEEDVVKKGWYQFKDSNGKLITTTYWADNTGYHAFGDHLPKSPPTPPAIQASIDQNAKEEAAKNQYTTTTTTTRRPIYYDPPQQPQYPPPQPQYPPQQQQYPQPQQPYYPPAQPQQPYYPPAQPQQPYYPPQSK